MTHRPPLALDQLLVLADQATCLSDAFHLLERNDDLTMTVMSAHICTAEDLARDLAKWDHAVHILSHSHPTLTQARTALHAVTQHTRLAGEHLGEALVTHGRRPASPEPSTTDAQWDHKLWSAAHQRTRAARSLLTLVPAICVQAAAALAQTVPHTAAIQDITATRQVSLSPLQTAALRATAEGHLSLAAVGPSTILLNDSDLRLTMRTVNPLVNRGLVQYDNAYTRARTWRIRLTPAGRNALLSSLAHPLHGSTPSAAPVPSPPRRRASRR
ncbi:hypothetical protein AB0G74_22115 [Streptomyces sp. NPDC020875]|uniref:hypothetical protein n=1 Tax=Streptomyces sp. NPDC020875 TaxID=3154898 RepID=UPI0033DB3D5D